MIRHTTERMLYYLPRHIPPFLSNKMERTKYGSFVCRSTGKRYDFRSPHYRDMAEKICCPTWNHIKPDHAAPFIYKGPASTSLGEYLAEVLV